jgi:hypothetical protein
MGLMRIGLLPLAVMATACAPDAVTAPSPVREPVAAAASPTSPEMRIRDVLQGRGPGVSVRSAAERTAGGSVHVTIREGWPQPPGPPPLYVLDGVPMSPDALLAAELDPTEIVSIDVVKGPAAVQAYGDRGRNGALSITTKRVR